LTCAGVLSALARRARDLPPLVLEECRAQAELLGPAYANFFERALLSCGAAQPVSARAGDVAGERRDLARGVEGPAVPRSEATRRPAGVDDGSAGRDAPRAGASPARALISL